MRTGADMYFGQNVRVAPVALEEIAEEVSHNSTATKADILAILTEFEHQFIKTLRGNKSIHMGLLGSFRATMRSVASRLPEEFTRANIRKIAVVFTPSATMKYELKADNPELTFVKVEPND